MKKYSLISLLLLVPVYSFANDVDLKSVITTAMENSRTIKISQKNVERSFGDVKIAESYGLPSVNLSGGFNAKESNSKKTETKTLGLYMGYNIYNGNKTTNSINIAINNKQKAIIAHKKNISGLVIYMAKIYYGIKRHRILKKSYMVALQNNKKIMEIEKQKYEKGLNDKTLYLDAETNYYNTKVKLANVETTLSSLGNQYYNLIGTEVPKKLPDADLSSLEIITSLDDAIKKAQKNNIDVQTAKLNLENAKYEHLNALAEYSPVLSVNGAIKQKNDVKTNEVSGGITYTVPIFDGGRNATKANNAKLKRQQSEMYYKRAMDVAKIDTTSYWRNYISSKQSLLSYKKSFNSLKMSLEVEQARYKNNNTPSSKLLDIQNKKMTAEANYLSAIQTSFISILNLLIITGEFDMELLENIQ